MGEKLSLTGHKTICINRIRIEVIIFTFKLLTYHKLSKRIVVVYLHTSM